MVPFRPGAKEFEGSAGDAASPGCTVDPVGDLGLAFQDEGGYGADELTVTGDPRSVMSGEDLTLAECNLSGIQVRGEPARGQAPIGTHGMERGAQEAYD